jgi:RNA polymerase sigma-70 factor (ECF subfamily)
MILFIRPPGFLSSDPDVLKADTRAAPWGIAFAGNPTEHVDRKTDIVIWLDTTGFGTDAALMRSFGSRDGDAARVLYDRFAGRVYGLGRVMLGSDQAAQDLVQDTFVRMFRKAEAFDPDRGRLDTWVLLIARSIALDSLRRRVIEARSLRGIGRDPEASAEPGPDEIAVDADMGTRARHAMDLLPAEQKAALQLAYFGGKTAAEVAELEGIPLGTAKTRIRTALLRMREEMKESE